MYFKHVSKRTAIAVSVGLILAMLGGVVAFSGSISAATAKPGGDITVGITSGPTTFNPWDLGNFAFPIVNQFYNVLAQYDENMVAQPQLATAWEFNQDGTAITLHLREGVKFQSGRELTAQDVIFSLQTATSPDVQANLKPLAKLVDEAVADDKYTVTLKFKKPNPAVFDLLDLLFIVDKDGWDSIRTKPAGTGPFVLANYVPGSTLELARFEDYWSSGYPLLDKVTLRVVSDPQALLLNLESGTLDVIWNYPARELRRLERNSRLTAGIAAKGSLVIDLLVNTSWGPLKDPKVRKAINLAINRKRFTRLVLSGISEPQCLPWQSNSLAYDPELEKTCAYNPDAAKKLLAEAGYPNGFDLVITTSTQRSSDWTKFAEMLQSDLANIGINATIEDLDAAAHLQRQRAGEFQISVHNFGRGNKDPASLFGTATVWKPLANSSHYRNDEFTELVDQAATTIDKPERKALYHKINQIVLRDNFIMSIAARPRPWAAQKKVQDIGWSIDGLMQLENTWLDR